MKSVAVTLAASLGLLIGGCAGEKPMHGGASSIATPTAAEQPVDAGNTTEDAAATPSAKLAAVGISASSENSGGDLSAEATTERTRGGTAGPGNGDGSVRDAKEAAEDAARRIFDATVEAASRIKDAGVGAVQAVRESTARKNDDSANQTGTEGAEIPGNGSATADSARD